MQKVITVIRYYMFSSIRHSSYIILLLSALALFSCGSDDPVIENQPAKPDPTPTQPEVNHFLNLSVVDSLTVDHIEGSFRISVITDTTFTVDVNSDWVKIEEQTYGHVFLINYSANDAEEERSAVVTFKSDAGIKRTVQVKQDFETKIISTEYKVGNDLLGEANVARLKLNRKVKNVSATMVSTWLKYDRPEVNLLEDKQTIEITSLQGFSSNYSYNFDISAENGRHYKLSSDIWLCDDHWCIEGRLEGYTVRNTKPDHSYAVTNYPDRFYGFNSYNGNPYFSLDLTYTPKGIDYCALTDEIYVVGEDRKLHIYDANDGSHHRDIVLPPVLDYGTYCSIVITDEGWGIVASLRDDRCMFDASRNDTIYYLPGFDDWSSYPEMRPSLGSDGKIWFSTDHRQLYKIESANGPVTQPANIDGRFEKPDVYFMGGVWTTYVWKPGQNKVLISASPTSQTIFNFDTEQYDFYTMIESRCGGGLAFDVTQPSSVDRLWWVRKDRFMDGTGMDFLIVEDKKVIFWSKDTRNQLSMIKNLPDGKNMIVAFEKGESDLIQTYFEIFDVEKFNAASNFSESYAGW